MYYRTTAAVAAIMLLPFFAAAADMNTNLDNAKESFVRHDTKAAAAGIRNAARSVEREAEHAGGDTKTALKHSARELDTLAADVEHGSIAGAEALGAPFARACHATAESHFAKSSEAFTKRQFASAGKELKASAHDLEAAAKWNRNEISQAAVSSTHDAQTVASQAGSGQWLDCGRGWTHHAGFRGRLEILRLAARAAVKRGRHAAVSGAVPLGQHRPAENR